MEARGKILDQFPHDAPLDWKKIESLYPGISDQFLSRISDIQSVCIDRIDPLLLDPSDTEMVRDYIAGLISDGFSNMLKSGTAPFCYASYDKDQSRYYLRSFFIQRDHPGQILLSKIIKGEKSDISPEEFKKIMEYEQNMVKLHVNIPPDRRKDFLKAYFSGIEKAYLTRKEIRRQKEAGGETNPVVTDDDLIAAGVRPLRYTDMKMVGFDRECIHDQFGNRVAELVFFLDKIPPQDRQAFIDEMSLVIRDFESQDGEVPRYSELVAGPDGYRHTSFSVTQGDSNLKDYLKKKGILDQYFDASRNHAIMIGQ